jgi:hypothetical protein
MEADRPVKLQRVRPTRFIAKHELEADQRATAFVRSAIPTNDWSLTAEVLLRIACDLLEWMRACGDSNVAAANDSPDSASISYASHWRARTHFATRRRTAIPLLRSAADLVAQS